MTIEPPTDAELLRATATGDSESFKQFVERHRSAVYRYLCSRTGDANAEDALQQTFIQAWRHAGTLVIDHDARAWLFTVARNALARSHRHSHEQGTETIDSLGERAGFAAVDASPERFAAAAEEQILLQRALRALPDLEREILILRDLEQLSGEHVAEVLSLSLTAMKSRLHRARLRLVAELRSRLPAEESR